MLRHRSILNCICFISLWWTECCGFLPSSSTKRQRFPVKSALQTTFNPNEQETPEQRQRRMEQVRQIQSAFYKSDYIDTKQVWSVADAQDPSLMHNLPLWRVQWTELPGYQNVLNVHVPHYTHMFRQLLYQKSKDQWYFGHVYLPGGSENLGNPIYALPKDEESGETTATTIGTLMRITDYKEEADGRLTMLVQGVDRLQILAASQQVPYAVADTVRLLNDWEASKVEHDQKENADAYDDLALSYRLKRAQAVAAVYEASLWRTFEFAATSFPPTDQVDDVPVTVSALSNFNASALQAMNWEELHRQVDKVFTNHAEPSPSDAKYIRHSTVEQELLDLERQVWIRLDVLLRLLEGVQPGIRIPVPTQILGLLPLNTNWPNGFRLEGYAERLEAERAVVGTATKSPFVRVSRGCPEYPVLRRCSRLSYVVWLLMESIAVGTDSSFSRQAYLETHGVRRRLQKTLDHLDGINSTLQRILK